jgi:hypothetical protein
MKAKYKIVISGAVIVVGLFVWNYFGPYNIFQASTANNLADFTEIEQQLDGHIENIKYIGRNTYQVHTNKKDYIIVEYFRNSEFLKFKVYEDNNKKINVFLNPM